MNDYDYFAAYLKANLTIMQTTKRQHWVPQFYLKKFANNKGFLEILDLKKKGIVKSRPYGSVCYNNFFYGVKTGVEDDISQDLEDYFTHIENVAAKAMEQFVIKILNNEKITDDILYSIAYFMSSLWVRSDQFRKQMIKMSEDMYKQTLKMRASSKGYIEHMKSILDKDGCNISVDAIKEAQKMLISGEFEVKYDNNGPHLQIIPEIDKFTNLFFNKYWRIHIAPENEMFITSDTSIIDLCPERKSFYGASFLERKQYFAISPKILIELVYPISGKKLIRKRVDCITVLNINLMRANYSSEFCYSSDKNIFSKMIKIAISNNPISRFFKNRI